MDVHHHMIQLMMFSHHAVFLYGCWGRTQQQGENRRGCIHHLLSRGAEGCIPVHRTNYLPAFSSTPPPCLQWRTSSPLIKTLPSFRKTIKAFVLPEMQHLRSASSYKRQCANPLFHFLWLHHFFLRCLPVSKCPKDCFFAYSVRKSV